ncbi:MAG: hypothetical protein MK028_05605 [Dehalococcoidia bacterium]|nr:hypothetical protein [Chloroflexota bacterium]MCH2525780.1 hypothetical protein [Dehalococcoidia bacterium]MQF99770.1 hypothetical protein [SAR202 cluster bacterium]
MNKTRSLMLVSIGSFVGSLVAIVLNQDLDTQTNFYILLAGISVLCLIYSVYIDIKAYIGIHLIHTEPDRIPIVDRAGEITDDDIAEEIQRHMDDHKHS